MFPIKSCAKQQIYIGYLYSKGRLIKSLKMISGMICNLNQGMQPKCSKVESDVPTPIRIDWTSCNFQSESDKMYWSKVWVQEFWYVGPGLDIQSEQSGNYNPVHKKWFQVAITNNSITVYFLVLIQIYGSVVKASSSGLDSWWVLKASTASRPLRGTEPVSARIHALFMLLLSTW